MSLGLKMRLGFQTTLSLFIGSIHEFVLWRSQSWDPNLEPQLIELVISSGSKEASTKGGNFNQSSTGSSKLSPDEDEKARAPEKLFESKMFGPRNENRGSFRSRIRFWAGTAALKHLLLTDMCGRVGAEQNLCTLMSSLRPKNTLWAMIGANSLIF